MKTANTVQRESKSSRTCKGKVAVSIRLPRSLTARIRPNVPAPTTTPATAPSSTIQLGNRQYQISVLTKQRLEQSPKFAAASLRACALQHPNSDGCFSDVLNREAP